MISPRDLDERLLALGYEIEETASGYWVRRPADEALVTEAELEEYIEELEAVAVSIGRCASGDAYFAATDDDDDGAPF